MPELLVTQFKKTRITADTHEDALARVHNGEGTVILTAANVSEYQNPAVPRDQWPLWAKALAKAAKPEDKGIGDVIARVIGPDTSAAFKKWHLKVIGRPCKCEGRQRQLNIKYPLP